MSKFQIGLLVIFGVFIVVAVFVFSFYRGASSSRATVLIWGSLPSVGINSLLNSAEFGDQGFTIHYVEKPEDELLSDFTEALAQGEGPDLLLLPQDDLWQARNKIVPIPYGSISQRNFQDTFAEGSEIFLTSAGIFALPLAVDPMVLYYNRDILSSEGLARPLAYWDEIYTQAAKLTKRDPAGNITRSTIALGETRNIGDFKDILSLLFLQAGTSVTLSNNTGLHSTLLESTGSPVAPGESALDFYTQFANPTKPFYSWNRSLPDAEAYFAAGDAAYYIGFASELPDIKRKSPTLNLGVAPVPQSRVSGKKITFGKTYGFALSRGTKDSQTAIAAAMVLISQSNASTIAANLGLPPVRRDLLSAKPTDAVGPIVYDAALQAHAWLDPEPAKTKAAFQEAIEAVTSGRSRTLEALNTISRRIDDLTQN